MNSYFNTDFKTGIDWSTVGDYSSAFDNINSEAFGKPNSESSSWNDFDLTKALTALGKSQRRKEYSNWAKQTPRFGFSNQNNRNPGAFPLGQDAVILPGSDQMGGAGGYTIPGGSSGASTTQKLGQAALSVAPFTGPAAPFVAGAGAIASLFG